MISTLKNASLANKPAVEVSYSVECEKIAEILKKRGFLSDVKVFKPAKSTLKMIHLELAEKDGAFFITDTKRISKPGRRIYKKSKDLYAKAGKFGVLIVSTPKGIMDSFEAKKKNLGGEVLCEVS